MRIGFDAKRYFNNTTGLGNYSRWLIQALSVEKKIELHLYSPEANGQNIPSGVEIHGPKAGLNGKLWRVKTICRDLQKDKIQLFHGLSNELPFGIHRTGIKSVITIHDLIQKRYPENYSWIDRRIYNRKLTYAQKCADAIVVPSLQTKKDLISYFNTDENKIKIIPLGIPPIPEFDTLEQAVESKYILCVSSFSRRKNLLNLIKAFNSAKLKDYKLVIAGKKGDTYLRTERLCDKNKNILLLPDPDSTLIHRLYAHALFCIYPSRFEGFGLPVLESFSHGKTLALSHNSSLPEVGGNAVVYFDPDNISSIKAAMSHLVHSDQHRNELEAKIQARLDFFSDKRIIPLYTELYQSLRGLRTQ